MMSLSIQPGNTFRWPSFPSQKSSFKLFKASIPMNHRAFPLRHSSILDLRSRPITRIQRLFVSAVSTETVTAENTEDPVPTQETEKVKVVVKQIEKPRLVLKFIWMEKNIGLALDQVIPGHGTIPLSPYYFWPRKDAWEELKATLETKPWISQKKTIILLNQATDIINLWQQSGGNLSQ